VVELRGNIQTRLSKVPEGGAIVMAVAALEVLGLTHLAAEVLSVGAMVPMVGQGTVAVECRSSDTEVLATVAALDDAPTRAAVETERAFLAELGAGCSMPVGALVDGAVLHTFLADPTTGRHVVGRDDLAALDPSEWRSAGAEAARRARRAVGG
jgi:hydroxymethylbilane synthase